MFGRQARLPLNVMFETNIQTQSNNTPGEYATALQKWLRTAYDLVRNDCLIPTSARNSSMIKKFMGSLTNQVTLSDFIQQWQGKALDKSLIISGRDPLRLLRNYQVPLTVFKTP